MTDRRPPKARVVSCPTCGAAVAWLPESRYRPFCSERCRLIDLGQWAAGGYRVAGEATADDEAGPPPAATESG